MCGEAVIDQSPGGQQQSFVADVKYKSLSINLAKDIKNDYYDHYYDSARTDGVLFQNYFLPQVVTSDQRMVRVENMVERGVGHIFSLR